MPIYSYQCNRCSEDFERLRPMAECSKEGECPKCGQPSSKVFSKVHDHWGWILTESSHHKGATDTWVPFRPSNEPIVDSTKAPYTKTIY